MIEVAIIGAGPKGLFAAERLVSELAAHAEAARLTLFDPRPPGEGAAYSREQPDYLRLNVTSSIVDAGWRGTGAPGFVDLPPFDQWRTARGESTPVDPFPPRALVGEYLAEIWSRMRSAVPAGIELTWRGRMAESIVPDGERWRVDEDTFDEVLLATGHASDWPGALRHHWTGRARLVPGVYPVQRQLGENDVPPGSRVAMRGAALTFIDAALALSEGRGGTFTGTASAFTYRPSGAEPAQIIPTARHARFMEIKPQPGSSLNALDLTAKRQRGLEACLAAAGDVPCLVDSVRATALDYLATAAGRDAAVQWTDVDAVVAGCPVGDPVAALRTSLAVALGEAPPGAAWAVGQAWRDLYPAIVATMSHTGAAVDWKGFAAVAATLERIAFGPPPINGSKLLALIEAGLIDPSHLGGSLPLEDLPADVVIDAVLPPPGVVGGSLVARLVECGQASVADDRRGLLIAPDGACLRKDGNRVPGLSAVGRPTEDVVVGNDTLSRPLHQVTAHWAACVARRCL